MPYMYVYWMLEFTFIILTDRQQDVQFNGRKTNSLQATGKWQHS
jgi:hypothetical protein